ncbi:MAG: hypothetical protein JWM09_273 [Francisellaceae bacterium]|nr:hypothetical protein [Francisellaceae bacterium]
MPQTITFENLLAERDTLYMIDYLNGEIACLIDCGASLAFNIAQESTKLEKIIQLTTNHDLNVALKDIQAWQQQVLKENVLSSYDRGMLIFSKGKISKLKPFLEEINHKFEKNFSGKSYNVDELFELIELIKNFESEFQLISFDTNPKFEALYDFIQNIFTNKTQNLNQFNEIRLIEINDFVKDKTEIFQNFLLFIEELKSRTFKTIATIIDEAARKQGLIPAASNLESLEKILSFYDSNTELALKIKALSKLTNIVPIFQNLRNFFGFCIIHINQINNIPVPVKRLRYFNQSLDKAIIYNPGFCFGGILEWLTDFTDNNSNNFASINNEFIPSQYSQLHDFQFRPKTFLLQNNQDSFRKLNHSSDHFIIRQEGKNIIAGEGLATTILKHLEEILSNYLLRYPVSPIIQIGLMGLKNGHAIGLRAYSRQDNIYYQFRDLNSGEYEFNKMEDFHKWFTQYLAIMGYNCYNKYTLLLLQSKQLAYSELMVSYFKSIANSNQSFFKDLISQKEDENLRNEMITLYLETIDLEEKIPHYEKINEYSHKIKERNDWDNLFLAFNYSNLCLELEDINPEGVIKYACKLILKAQNYTDQIEWNFLEFVAVTTLVYSKRSINKSLQDEDIKYINKMITLNKKLLNNINQSLNENNIQNLDQFNHTINNLENILIKNDKNLDTINQKLNEYLTILQESFSELTPQKYIEFLETIREHKIQTLNEDKKKINC